MDAHSSKSIQCESDDAVPPEAKRKRPATPEPLTKLTDFDDLCLEKIFMGLDIVSIISVAVANEFLRTAARVAFKKKFRMIDVQMNNDCYKPKHIELYENYHGTKLFLHGLRACLQFLRCISTSVNNVCIRFDNNAWSDKAFEHIREYFDTYCPHSSVTINFMDSTKKIPVNFFEKPFPNVRAVEICGCYFGHQIPLFAHCFPNLRSLSLSRIYTLTNVESPFQHLETLSFEVTDGESECLGFLRSGLFRMCPQLNSLSFFVPDGSPISLNTMSCILHDCPSIRKLKVKMIHCSAYVKLAHIQQFLDEQPLLEELDLFGYIFTVGAAIQMVRELKTMKTFGLATNTRYAYGCILSLLNRKWRPWFRVLYGGVLIKLQRS